MMSVFNTLSPYCNFALVNGLCLKCVLDKLYYRTVGGAVVTLKLVLFAGINFSDFRNK